MQGPYPHVLIIGAGLGGPALAQMLRKRGISFEIFERDAGPNSRFQGWSLGTHNLIHKHLIPNMPDDMPSTEVLDHLYPVDLPLQFAWYNADDASRRWGIQDEGTRDHFRANRLRLRDWLTHGYDVQWNKKAIKVEETNDHVTVYFEDGTSAIGDLLVGADGARSITSVPVLKYVTDKYHEDRPPLQAVFGNYKVTGDDLLQQLNIAHSAYTVSSTEDDKRSFFAAIDHMDQDGKTAHCFWSLYWEDLHPGEPYWTQSATAQDLLEFVQKQTASFDPSLRLPIEKTTVDGIVLPPLSFHEVELQGSDLKPGRITCIGDAAHSMMPTRGQGGVSALHDAVDLAKAIAKIRDTGAKGKELEKIMAEYHEVMQGRALEAIHGARMNYKLGAEHRRVWTLAIKELPKDDIHEIKLLR
ncbi:uncharacterized protein A1O9_04713 [Exophiala aquamarina CBS 119918]|uniref:FAD-binding domain-containing protein n=1 Tax=Exophiala aquamarina CBS 119918 TaxID=1182545 RepID=A0A072PWB5_9EURO|nr:uncharacterized protein A1O9_04713 [Exophiala aquamarina CBS 119918]KEF59865.1 hypothetical protein A1O9_04713 [Exophiala aquamarina CBS 119918]